MKKKSSIQPMLIIGTILLIGVIIFGLYKFGVLEKDTGKNENPPVSDVVEKDDDEELIDDVDIEEEDQGNYDIEIGKLAPDFTLTNLDGEEVSLSDYRDKYVLLNFWASWCPPCDKEMPDLQKLSEENDDLVVLAVNSQEDKELVAKYIEKGGYNFEVALDGDGRIGINYLVSSLPTTFIIDKDGILLAGIRGMLTWPQMNEIIESIRQGE